MAIRLTQCKIDKGLRAGRHFDGRGHGLSLLVKPNGRSYWTMRTMIHGKQADIGLGSAATTTLQEARRKAEEKWKVARDGGDPRSRVRQRMGKSFRDLSEQVITMLETGWTAPRQGEKWRRSLEEYVHPMIGNHSVSSITTADIREKVILPIWHEKNSVAKEVLSRTNVIFKNAKVLGLREDNPVEDIPATLPRVRRRLKNHDALSHAEVGKVMEELDTLEYRAAALAIQFTILTAGRVGEIMGATWDEIDASAKVWTVPAERMKTRVEHRVPLSEAALKVLDDASLIKSDSNLIFPSLKGKELIQPTLYRELNKIRKTTLHGFRSSFRDWCGENRVDRDIAEACLAHKVRNAVEAAYLRSDYLERRRDVMEAWGGYVG